MNRNYAFAHVSFLILLPLLFSISCSLEDDVESIFFDKTWYVSGLTINGLNVNGDEIKELYSYKESYYLYFYSNYSFYGTLSTNSIISGTWHINGNNQKIHIVFDDTPIVSTKLNILIYNILQNASYYSGDINNITIFQNKSNFITFTYKK